MEIYGFAPWGFEGHLVRIEVDLRRGIPGLEMVGLPGSAVREARERVRIALSAAGFQFPADRILVNLSPADIPKTGSGYDLPLALALLAASGQWRGSGSLLAVGELSLDGSLRSVTGTLAAAVTARERGLRTLVLPLDSVAEASGVPGLNIIAGSCLSDLLANLNSLHFAPVQTATSPETQAPPVLRGQPQTLRALQVAAAGGHSLLLFGPPGSGKTLAARTLEHLLPPWPIDSALQTSRIWSLAGKLPPGSGLLRRRPFREPHHSASAQGILGGGLGLLPGEISLAHQGVLFLDEAPEYSSRLLQALREPLEAGKIHVVRAGMSVWYPSRFALVMTANGCPCGQSGRDKGVCFCSAQTIRRYWDRLGNALMDRVELRLFLKPVPVDQGLSQDSTSWVDLKAPVELARKRQSARGQDVNQANVDLDLPALRRFSGLQPAHENLLGKWGRQEDWSTRALQAVLKVALTLADLDDSVMELSHIEQACRLRSPQGGEPWRD